MAVQVKICGLTRVADAVLAADLGAAFVGLNFHPSSPRCLAPSRAREIAAAVRGRTQIVGVFADAPVATMEAILAEVGCDLVQLHGTEAPAVAAAFGARAVKAFRGVPAISELERYASAGAFLVDALADDRPGGTGRPWSWDVAALAAAGKPLFVAGGIRPDNAAVAARGGADVLDVCSGVEARPGIKDPALLERLFRAVADG
jgi:phosphoribosylanthranilate isomerase